MSHTTMRPLFWSTPVGRLLRPFQQFARTESSGGIVLLLATIIALLWANSSLWESYFSVWETELVLDIGTFTFAMSFGHFINDGLMVVFFFMVGLEIKREMLVGELSSLRASALPIAAAIGGMLVPAFIYFLVNRGGEGAHGWGIPMATDIAFALGVLALMGSRIPWGLRVFLAALAIADDLGAVLVIAFFYTEELNLTALGLGAVLVAGLVALNWLGVRRSGPYAVLGFLLWLAFLASGVHATIAGVLLAMTVPVRTRLDTDEFLQESRVLLDGFEDAGEEGKDVLTNEGQQAAIQGLEAACEAAQSPLMRIENYIQPWVAFGIVPLFALANAGVRLRGTDLAAAIEHPVSLGIILGLVLGKPIGITLAAWLAVRSGVAVLPSNSDWRQLHAISWLGGIGFTMSLFVTNLAFGSASELLDEAKFGILCASTIAALMGWLLVISTTRRRAVD